MSNNYPALKRWKSDNIRFT